MVRLNQNPKILLLCSGLDVAGGLERMVVSMANLLSENGYTVSLLILDNITKSFYPINNNVCVQHLNINFGIGGNVNYLQRKLNFIKDILALRKKIISLNADIIITSEYPQTAALIAGQLHKKYSIIAWQHSSYYQSKNTLWKKLSDYAYKKVQAIVCLNEDEKKVYSRFNSNTIVIPNFIELSELKSDLNSKTILTIARLSKEKGIDWLMQAAKLVLPKHPDWKWKVIGDGALKESLIDFISENYLSESLLLQQPNTALLTTEYENASIYVLSSRRETFGLVLLEAMSHGVPCVAFDCDTGPRHIITHNIDGILVEKENPEKMAEAISLLIENKEKCSQMGKAAFKNIKRFSADVIVKKWEELFNSLLHS